jgi:hypothetical protein
MKLEKAAIWASLPLTVVGLVISFFTLVAGAGHGDKSLVLFIFPLPAFAWVLGGFIIGMIAACIQFPLYALVFYTASKRGWGWPVAGVLLLAHVGVVFWILSSG